MNEHEQLIAEARTIAKHSAVSLPEHADCLRRLADALEAATREDDREAVTGNELADAVHVYREASGKPANSEGIRAVLALSRDAAPDAATEREIAVIEEHREKWMARAFRAEAERDAALAAIERVQETLSLHNPNGRLVKEVLAALDGAPEPAGLPVEGEKP